MWRPWGLAGFRVSARITIQGPFESRQGTDFEGQRQRNTSVTASALFQDRCTLPSPSSTPGPRLPIAALRLLCLGHSRPHSMYHQLSPRPNPGLSLFPHPKSELSPSSFLLLPRLHQAPRTPATASRQVHPLHHPNTSPCRYWVVFLNPHAFKTRPCLKPITGSPYLSE